MSHMRIIRTIKSSNKLISSLNRCNTGYKHANYIIPVVLQLVMKKLYVYGAIAFIWIVIPALTIMFSAVVSDIVQGTCRMFSVYKNYATAKTIGFFSNFFSYWLPLTLMVFFYGRLVHALRTKVILP